MAKMDTGSIFATKNSENGCMSGQLTQSIYHSFRSLLCHWLMLVMSKRLLKLPSRFTKWCLKYWLFRYEFKRFQQLSESSGDGRGNLQAMWRNRIPCLADRTGTTRFDRHYVYHTAWAARKLAQMKPSFHCDFSSLIYFPTMMSSIVPITFYEYRPTRVTLPGLKVKSADLLQLPFADQTLLSISCMHVVEHLGLGRYGDPLDPAADRRAMAELARVLAPGGSLLFVTPIGKPCVRFNAHRIYSADQIRDAFAELDLHEFVLIPDYEHDGDMVRDPSPELLARQRFACGCFLFMRSQ